MRFSHVLLASALTALLALPAPAAAAQGTSKVPAPTHAPPHPWHCDASPLTITNARLPASPSETVTIKIQNGRIAAIVPATAASATTEVKGRVLDADGGWLLPGFLDAHSHLDTLPAAKERSRSLDFQSQVLPITLRATLASGVTAARVHLSRFEDLPLLHALADAPCAPGPRLQLAGPGLLGGAPTVESPLMVGARDAEHIAAHIHRSAKLGAQWIALHGVARFDTAARQAIQDAAAEAGIRLLAAADNRADFEAALAFPARTLEYLDRSDAPRLDDALTKRAAGRAAIVPPIGYYQVAERLWSKQRDIGAVDPFVDESVPGLWADMAAHLPAEIAEDDYVRRTAASVPTHLAKFHQLLDHGVAVLLGTDSGSPGQMHHRAIWNEIAAWQAYGATSQQVLRAATETAAHWLEWPDVGEIQVGHHADLLVYQGKLDQRLTPASLTAVVKGGVIYLDAGRWVGPDADQTRQILDQAKLRSAQAARP